MTREQKIAKARQLRAEGMTAGQIAAVVDAPESTVRNWYLGGNCENCGTPVDGGSGSNSSTRCAACALVADRKRSRERIIERIKAWAAEYGAPPTFCDWAPARAAQSHAAETTRLIRERYESGDWPASDTVRAHFGTFNAGIEAAGFAGRRPGEHGGPGSKHRALAGVR